MAPTVWRAAQDRAEEAAFLADMHGTPGERAMAAPARIRDRLGLDDGGVDFGLTMIRSRAGAS